MLEQEVWSDWFFIPRDDKTCFEFCLHTVDVMNDLRRDRKLHKEDTPYRRRWTRSGCWVQQRVW